MSVAVVMRCDINTCKTESKEMKKTRIMDKEYDLCPNCHAKLTDFVGRRLEGGRTVPESTSSGTIQISSGGQIQTVPSLWPSTWSVSGGGGGGSYTLGGYTNTSYIPLPVSAPQINPDVQAVFDTMLGVVSPPTIIDAPEK